MLEMAIHGRGGQGVKTAGDLLVHALFAEGYRVNGQPLYGGERMGAPVAYYIRCNRSGTPIDDRSLVRRPAIMLMFDASMLASAPGLAASLHPEGVLLVNTRKAAADLATWGALKGPPMPPDARGAPAEPWRPSTSQCPDRLLATWGALKRLILPRDVATLPATEIARDCGLVRGSVALVGPVMVGAFAGLTGLVTLETLTRCVTKGAGEIPPDRIEANLRGLGRGHDAVVRLAPRGGDREPRPW